MRGLELVVLFLAAVSAVASNPQRIVGGTVVNDIEQYNSAAVLLRSVDLIQPYVQNCGGAIINQRSILTAGQCFVDEIALRWVIRVGSTTAHSGGVTYSISSYLIHPEYNRRSRHNDLALLRTASFISYTNTISSARIGGYFLDEQITVQAIGWGRTSALGQPSEQLRKTELLTVKQESCRRSYPLRNITERMLCAGWVGGGRGQCTGDAGSPLYHQGTVVAVTSFSNACGVGTFPGVYTRVSEFVSWIVSNS